MKRMVLTAALALCCCILQAQPDSAMRQFYYYPEMDVYHSEVTGDYWYYDKPSTHWMSVKVLPANFQVNASMKKYEVWYRGPNVWMDNKLHRKNYKIKPKDIP